MCVLYHYIGSDIINISSKLSTVTSYHEFISIKITEEVIIFHIYLRGLIEIYYLTTSTYTDGHIRLSIHAAGIRDKLK